MGLIVVGEETGLLAPGLDEELFYSELNIVELISICSVIHIIIIKDNKHRNES